MESASVLSLNNSDNNTSTSGHNNNDRRQEKSHYNITSDDSPYQFVMVFPVLFEYGDFPYFDQIFQGCASADVSGALFECRQRVRRSEQRRLELARVVIFGTVYYFTVYLFIKMPPPQYIYIYCLSYILGTQGGRFELECNGIRTDRSGTVHQRLGRRFTATEAYPGGWNIGLSLSNGVQRSSCTIGRSHSVRQSKWNTHHHLHGRCLPRKRKTRLCPADQWRSHGDGNGKSPAAIATHGRKVWNHCRFGIP